MDLLDPLDYQALQAVLDYVVLWDLKVNMHFP
jgi:hypothetical protein